MPTNSQSVLRSSIGRLLLVAPVWLAIPMAGHAQDFAGRYELVEDSGTPVPYAIDAAGVEGLFSCSGQITEAQMKGAVQTLLPDGTWRTMTTLAGRCKGRDGRQRWMEASTEGGRGTYTASRGEARLIASTGLASVLREQNGVFAERFRDEQGREQVQVWRRVQRPGASAPAVAQSGAGSTGVKPQDGRWRGTIHGITKGGNQYVELRVRSGRIVESTFHLDYHCAPQYVYRERTTLGFSRPIPISQGQFTATRKEPAVELNASGRFPTPTTAEGTFKMEDSNLCTTRLARWTARRVGS